MDFVALLIIGIMIINLIRHAIKSWQDDKKHERLYKQRSNTDKRPR